MIIENKRFPISKTVYSRIESNYQQEILEYYNLNKEMKMYDIYFEIKIQPQAEY